MKIDLDDADRAILRDCPIDLDTAGKLKPAAAARMKRIKRLWSAGFVGGHVVSKTRLQIRIRDAGRLAIGRPAIETQAAEGSDAPAP